MELLTNTRQVLWEKTEMLKCCKDTQHPNTHTQYNCHRSGCWQLQDLQSCSWGRLPRWSRTATVVRIMYDILGDTDSLSVQNITRANAELPCVDFSCQVSRLSQMLTWQCLIKGPFSISGQCFACNSSGSEQNNNCINVRKLPIVNRTPPALRRFQVISLQWCSCLHSVASSS